MSAITQKPQYVTTLATQDQLPYDDGETMETPRHKLQMDLLIDAITVWLEMRPDGYVGGNMFVYYNPKRLLNKDFKGPDFFVALGVPKGERKSWVVWQEQKVPNVIIELLSETTAETDKKKKKLIYQNRMKVPEYFWFDPFDPKELAGFRLKGKKYSPIAVNSQNQLVSEELGLALQRWNGEYKGLTTTWLRWATLEGQLLPTEAEKQQQRAEQERQRAEQERQRAEQEKLRAEQEKLHAEQEKQRAEQEKQRAEQEKQRAEQEKQRAEQEKQRAEQAEAAVIQIARNLLQQGMTPQQVASITGLSELSIKQLADT